MKEHDRVKRLSMKSGKRKAKRKWESKGREREHVEGKIKENRKVKDGEGEEEKWASCPEGFPQVGH